MKEEKEKKDKQAQPKRALVLSGGSIWGCFQAGAIAEVLEQGFVPDAIYGTSVGSLNGGFLAERAGRAHAQGQEPDWPEIGKQLEAFWTTNLTSPRQIGSYNWVLAIIPVFIIQLAKLFNGIIDTKPIQKLTKEVLLMENLRQSPVGFCACAVSVSNGAAVYGGVDGKGGLYVVDSEDNSVHDPTKNPEILLDCIIASTAIPIEMPVKLIDQVPYVDGGIREVAPLKRAIDQGATEIVSVVCQTEKVTQATIEHRDLLLLTDRLMGVVTNELVNNDMDVFNKVNRRAKELQEYRAWLVKTLREAGVDQETQDSIEDRFDTLEVSKWQHIPWWPPIRPTVDIPLNVMDFTPEQIRDCVQVGRVTARQIIEENDWQFTKP